MPRRPGRTADPLEKQTTTVGIMVRLSAQMYDEVYAAARRERISVPEVLRRVLYKTLDVKPKT